MTVFAPHLETWLFAYLLNSAWQIPLIVLAAWLAARLARRSGPTAEHRIWLSALALEVVLPACTVTPAQLLLQLRQLAHQLIGSPAAPAGAHITITTGPVYTHSGLHLPSALIAGIAIVYVCALFYLVVRLLWRLHRTSALLRQAEPLILSGRPLENWLRLRRLFVIENVALAMSPEITGPSAIARSILLPTHILDDISEEDLIIALAHELTHLSRQDFAKNLAYELLSLPIAWHPLLWFTRTRVAETREMICDALAADAIQNRASYARSLLRLASTLAAHPPAQALHAIGIFDANVFERRIMNLTEKRAELKGAARTAIAATCIALFLATCASAMTLHMGISAFASPDAAHPSAPQNESEPSAPGAVRVSGGVMAGQIISKVNPIYPPIARASGVAGIVVLHAVISETGTIQQLNAISGPPMLVAAAMDAVKQWTYQPYLLNGNPVAVETTITVNFSLGNGAGQQPPSPPPPPQADNEDAHPLGGSDGVAYNVGGSVRPPVVLFAPDPEYSEAARKAKLSGNVIVSLIVDSAGEPQNVRVARGLGNVLDEKAVEAVQQYRFNPATQNGEPVPANLKVQVNFQIF
jgi:TonB family protein